MMAPMDESPGRTWALPGTAADEGAAVDADESSAEAMVEAADPGARAPAAGPTRGTPVLGLRPMTVADILDGGFAVLKARPQRILGMTALFVVPAQLLIAFLQRDALASDSVVDIWTADPTVLEEQANTTTAEVVATFLQLLLPALALVAIAAALAHLVSGWSVGRDPPAGEMLRLVGRRSWALLASFVLVKLAEGIGILGCYVGVLFVMPLFVSVAPVIGVEGGGPVAAIKRSWQLTGRRYWPVLGIALLMGAVSFILGLGLSFLPQALAAWIGLEAGWPLLALGQIVQHMLILPFVAAATVLLYLDLRVRTEGLDIELDASEVFDRGAGRAA
jgi:hypothetical protein